MKTIRKLSLRENLKLSVESTRHFSRSIRVETGVMDLFARPDVLNRAIRLWKSTHPLLQARVAPVDGVNYFVFEQTDDSNDDEATNLDNVKYLLVESTAALPDRGAFFNDLAWLVCQKALDASIDHFNEPLWRLVFLRIDRYEYEITLVMHHSISEGRNGHMLLLQLFDLVEYVWSSNSTERPNLTVFEPAPSLEELYFDHYKTESQARSIQTCQNAVYMDPIQASQSPHEPPKWAKQLAHEWLFELTAESGLHRYIQLGELVEASKAICFKSKRFTLSELETARFLDKCKAEGCSVNCALGTVLAYAFKQLSLRVNSERGTNADVEFIRYNAVSMRQFAPTLDGFVPTPAFTSNLSIGYYISSIYLTLDYLTNYDLARLEDAAQFWRDARADSARLLDSIRAKEIYQSLVIRKLEPGEGYSSFSVSNLGNMPARLADEFAVSPRRQFAAKAAYVEVSISRPDYYVLGPVFTFSSSCNRRLNIGFLVNSFVFGGAHFDLFVELFFGAFNHALE